MTIDLLRDGYDNLFLVGGYDWHAKMTAVNPATVEHEAKRLSTNFDKLNKKDVVVVAKWENEVLHACGLPGKPLPKVAPVVAPVKPVEAKPAEAKPQEPVKTEAVENDKKTAE